MDGQAQQRQAKVLETLRKMNIGGQIIDREDRGRRRRGLVQRMRDLVEDIERSRAHHRPLDQRPPAVARGSPESRST